MSTEGSTLTVEKIKKAIDVMKAHDDLPEHPVQPVIRSPVLIRPAGFEGRRAGETKDFANRRKKNRVRNKIARKARKR